MKKSLLIITLFSSMIFAQEFTYVGNSKCKMCHKKEEKGAQFSKWEASSHAHSFETLKTERASQIVSGKGLDSNAWEAPECLKCHTTGFENNGYEIMAESFWSPSADDKAGTKAMKRMEGLQAVGCESCHGAGNKYKSKKTMVAIYNDEIDGVTVGLKPVNEETCIVCHNDSSPTFKPFNYKERIKKISHPIPKG